MLPAIALLQKFSASAVGAGHSAPQTASWVWGGDPGTGKGHTWKRNKEGKGKQRGEKDGKLEGMNKERKMDKIL